MLERLGNVLYWIGCLLTAIALALNLYIWASDNNLRSDAIAFFLMVVIVPLVIWAIGRAFRYVLSGR
jgi:hypothetical protein